jgi:hypothetical protein
MCSIPGTADDDGSILRFEPIYNEAADSDTKFVLGQFGGFGEAAR